VAAAQSFVVAGSIGPVQEFILTARKTQDLWEGSGLLAELSRAAARAVEEAGGRLVAPASKSVEARDAVANKLLFVCDAERLEAATGALRRAPGERLEEIARAVREEILVPAGVSVDEDAWRAQLAQFPEVYDASTPWQAAPPSEAREPFAKARARAERLLDGRKQLRDFAGGYLGQAGVPKSALDGGLEAVFGEADAGRLRRRYGVPVLDEHELLDALGTVCRFYGRTDGGRPSWPSTGAIAAESFVQHLRRSDELRPLLDQVSRTREDVNALSLGALDRDRSDLLHEAPWRRRQVEAAHPHGLPRNVQERLDTYEDAVRDLLRAARPAKPCPYYAVVVADGDSIGSALRQMPAVEKHERLSLLLAEFTREVRTLDRETTADGRVSIAYAGGDDVLAFATQDRLPDLLGALRDAWERTICAADLWGDGPGAPTLSVGVGIVHAHDSMRYGIRLAQEALRAAKEAGRSRVGITLSRRSGGERATVLEWDEQPGPRLVELARLLGDREAPRGLAYELRRLVADLGALTGAGDRESVVDEVRRILARKRSQGGADEVDEGVRDRLLERSGVESAKDGGEALAALERFVYLVLVASHLQQYLQPDAWSEAESKADATDEAVAP